MKTGTTHDSAHDCEHTVHILGAGRMGEGIALAFGYAGYRATLVDMKVRASGEAQRHAEKVRRGLQAELGSLQALGLLDAGQSQRVQERIQVCSMDAAVPALVSARIIFEAVPEVLEAKRDCLAWLGEHCPPDAIIASTTSTFLVTQLAALVCNPQRFVNAHWLNPALLMPLVEVSRSADTCKQVVERLVTLLTGIGKVPVICAPVAGYIVPRLQALVMNEAARMVEQGVASAQDIDKAVNVGFGLRFSVLGLLEFIDWGGGDTLYYGSRYLADQLSPRFEPPAIIRENMQAGRNGLRDGEGFYNHENVDLQQYRLRRLTEFVQRLRLMERLPRLEHAFRY